MEIMFIIYRVIIGVLCLLTLWDLVKEKSLSHAMSLGIVSIPLILRTLLIK